MKRDFEKYQFRVALEPSHLCSNRIAVCSASAVRAWVVVSGGNQQYGSPVDQNIFCFMNGARFQLDSSAA